MSNKILFRAKSKHTNEWFEGLPSNDLFAGPCVNDVAVRQETTEQQINGKWYTPEQLSEIVSKFEANTKEEKARWCKECGNKKANCGCEGLAEPKKPVRTLSLGRLVCNNCGDDLPEIFLLEQPIKCECKQIFDWSSCQILIDTNPYYDVVEYGKPCPNTSVIATAGCDVCIKQCKLFKGYQREGLSVRCGYKQSKVYKHKCVHCGSTNIEDDHVWCADCARPFHGELIDLTKKASND